MFIKIMLVLALMAGLCHLIDFLFGTSVACRPSQMLGLKYTNTSGDTYRGTLDQRTYTTWKNMKVVKRKVIGITNPQSAKQNAIRTFFANLAVAWRNLTEEEKSLWETLGQQIPQPNPEQGVRALIRRSTAQQSGINTFISHNSRILQLGGVQILAPVIGPAPPGILTPSILWGIGSSLDVSWIADPGAQPLDTVRVWIVSRSTVGGVPLVHKQFVTSALVTVLTASSLTYTGALGAVIQFATVLGAELYVQCDVVNSADGYFSVPTETLVTTVA